MRYALDDMTPDAAPGTCWIAPNAVVIGRVVLHRNASIWWNAVLRGDNDLIEIGENSNIQDGCVLHTDPGLPLVVERDVTVGHLAMLHGCRIGEGSLIGIGAVVLNGARIGRNCLIAANALVTERTEIPDNSLVVGSPGKVARTVTEQQRQRMRDGTASYVEKWQRYAAGLKPLD